MSPDLFRQIVDARPSVPARRLSALPISILVHALVLAALVVIPLLASDVLPIVRGEDVLVMPIVLVPVPPAIPAPITRHAPMEVLANPDAAPVVQPSGIGRERLLQADPPTDVPVPEAVGTVPGVGVPGGTGVGDIAPPPARPREPVRAGGVIKAPVKVRDVSPIYPPMALAARVEGVVIIEAVIGVTGEVTEARVIRSKPLLDEAALAAVRQWRYTPTLLGGSPTPVILTVTVTFALK